MTELHHAAYCQDLEAVKRCVEQGFDVNQEDDGGWTAILWAIDMAAAAPAHGIPEAIVDYLLDHGAHFELKHPKYKTVLDFARHHDGYLEEYLIRRMNKKADPAGTDNVGAARRRV